MTTAAEAIRPWCFARTTTPRVPRLGTPRVRAHRRLAASSRMAVQSPSARATARTAVSPAPRPHSSTDTGTGGTATRVPQPSSTACPAGSVAGPASPSAPTAPGSRTSVARAVRRARCPALARVITGDAFTTQRSGTRHGLEDLRGLFLEGGDAKQAQRGQKLTPGEPGDLSRTPLGDAAQFIPLHGRRQPERPGKLLGIVVDGRQGPFGHVDGELNHRRSSVADHRESREVAARSPARGHAAPLER